jgi:hypothetical protein
MRAVVVIVLLFASVFAKAARADEGMWTFDHFPAAKMQAAYGWAPDAGWITHVRLSSLTIPGDCSASFVSADGLVMTNHHCARDCILAQSDKTHDYIADGFYAAALKDERPCSGYELDGLDSITDVTARIDAATKGKTGKGFEDAERAAIAAVQGACGSDTVTCQVVTLYHGGVYDLYKYRRYTDVRLVFSVEDDAANFGGDPDNFEYPRYDIDVTFLRVYQNGKPFHPADHFRFAAVPAKAGDAVVTSGAPEGTQRDDTVAQLEFIRDYDHPIWLQFISEQVGMLWEMQHESAEMHRESLSDYFYAMNTMKAFQGEEAALVSGPLLAQKQAAEERLRQRVAADPKLAGDAGAWDRIAAAQVYERGIYMRLVLLDQFPDGVMPDDVRQAKELLRYSEEFGKPDGERLPDYQNANLPATKEDIAAAGADYPAVDKEYWAWWLTDMRFYLGADDPDVKAILGKESPEQIADEIVTGTKLADAGMRAKLLAGGPAMIAASDDPLLVFMRRLDGPARKVLAAYTDHVTAVETRDSGLIARAKFALYGTSDAPDGTLTPRLSYGAVQGYEQDGQFVQPFTDFGGAFARATGEEPFKLPPRWVTARAAGMDMKTKLNMVTTNDIVGGNSGSPVIDRAGDLVGLVFDGDIQSLGGSFGFDPAVNRAVAVDVTALKLALTTIYHADRLVKEMAQ